MASPKPWYQSRTLWLLAAFVVLSIGEWAQQTWLPEAPLPEWVGAGKDILFGAMALWLRGVTSQPLSRRRSTASEDGQGWPAGSDPLPEAGIDPRADTEPPAARPGWADPELG